jgi:hypothetical protein
VSGHREGEIRKFGGGERGKKRRLRKEEGGKGWVGRNGKGESYRGNVSTEPLPSNGKGIFAKSLPSNDRGIHTRPRDRARTHTHTQQRDLISLFYFLK